MTPNSKGARWNGAGVDALYTSTTEETALAEWRHRYGLELQPPTKPFASYQITARLQNVLVLTTKPALRSVGVSDADLATDNPRACRAVGVAANWMGQDGLLVPSARHAGLNLVILTSNLGPSAEVSVLKKVRELRLIDLE